MFFNIIVFFFRVISIVYFSHRPFQNFKKYSFMRTYVKLFEKLGNMEGMNFFVGWLEDVIEFLFFVFSFDVVEEGSKVTF